MQPSYVHFASVPKTFLDKRRELLFNLKAFKGGGATPTFYLINEEKNPITFGEDRILLKPTRKILINGTKVPYALINSETGTIAISSQPTSEVVLNRNTKSFEIQNSASYEVYSTGNRLIYGLYNTVEDGAIPVNNVFVSDSDNASVVHIIENNVDAKYLVVYYEQGLRFPMRDAIVEKI